MKFTFELNVMNRNMEMRLVIGILLAVQGMLCSPSGPGGNCYDCNFAPSGYIKTATGYAKEVGYVRCALQQPNDGNLVDKPYCKSGVCFIRSDDNGLEYRGCADAENLPYRVDPNLQCKYQGSGSKPLWYFCTGSLCNGGQIGQDEEHCGQSPVQDHYTLSQVELPNNYEYEHSQAHYSQDDTSEGSELQKSGYISNYHPKTDHQQPGKSGYNQPSATKSGYHQDEASKSGYNQQPLKSGYNQAAQSSPTDTYPQSDTNQQLFMTQQNQGYTPTPDDFFRFWYIFLPSYWMQYLGWSQNTESPALHVPETKSLYPNGGYVPEYDGNNGYGEYVPPASNDEYHDNNNGEGAVDTNAISYDEYGRYDPCDGCADNPSGLYSDPTRPGQFIQCGCAIYNGVPCTCCYPFEMTCPNNTMFSDSTKQCVRYGQHPQHG